MGELLNELIPIPTYPKQRGRKSSSGLITIVVMTL